MVIEREKPNGMKAAIIGGGPAGITIAVELARKGSGVTIFDTKEKIGGVLILVQAFLRFTSTQMSLLYMLFLKYHLCPKHCPDYT